MTVRKGEVVREANRSGPPGPDRRGRASRTCTSVRSSTGSTWTRSAPGADRCAEHDPARADLDLTRPRRGIGSRKVTAASMCAPARGEPTCFRCAVTDRRAPSVSLPPRRSRLHRSRSCRARRSRKKRRPGRSSRGTRSPGVLADGPEPPYRVRWTLPAPTGDALSGAVLAGDLAVRSETRPSTGSTWSRAPSSGGGSGRGTAVDAGEPAHGGGSSSTSTGPVRTMQAEPGRDRRARARAPPRAVHPRRHGPALLPPSRTSSPRSRRSSRSPSRIGPSSGEHRWRDLAERGHDRRNERVRGRPRRDRVRRPWRAARSRGPRIWTHVDSPVAVADGQVVAVASNTDTGQVVVAAFDEATGERSWPALAIQANSTAGTRPQPAAVPVHRFGGPARGARREGRLRTMGDTGALAVLPGDLARVRRRERVRGGHRRWPVPARRRRWWAQVELPSERGRTAELARRLRLLAPTRAQRRSPRGARRRLRASGGRAPRPRGWSGRSRCRAIRSSR